MSDQIERAEQFAALHVKSDPIILFNIWDAGGAKAVAEAGAKAIATGSHSVAVANGYDDGQHVPLEFVLDNIARIVASVDLPVTLDFEGGYAIDADGLKINIAKVIEAGAIGINFEDQIVGGKGMYSVEEQQTRIAAVREAADAMSIPLFINARTDVFLKNGPETHHDHFYDAAKRAIAYAKAGASGIFAPGLKDPALIQRLCDLSPLPVNIMVMADTPTNKEMADLGVGRISYGPGPYRKMMESLKLAAARAFSFE